MRSSVDGRSAVLRAAAWVLALLGVGLGLVEVVVWVLIVPFAQQLALPFGAWSLAVGGAFAVVPWLAAGGPRDGDP